MAPLGAFLLGRIQKSALRMAKTVLIEAVDATDALCYEVRLGKTVDVNEEHLSLAVKTVTCPAIIRLTP